MSLIDYIRNLFQTNKKYPKIIIQDLHKTSGGPDKLEIGLYNDNKTPIADKNITININGVDYIRKTDKDGIARLNINLPVGKYDAHASFDDPDYIFVRTSINVIVNPIVTTSDLNMTEKDGSKFTATLTDSNGNKVNGKKVIFTVNGVDYERTTNTNGEASLLINLQTGDYKILTKCFDITKENNIHIAEKPKPTPTPPTPTPTPTRLYSYITSQGGGKLGQRTGYTCGPHSLMQAIYRLTGIELSEMELAGVCGTTTSGTGHSGLETGLAWFNRKYGYNLKMTWKNFSEVGFDGLQKYYEKGAVFLHLCYRLTWGHYEVPLTSSTDPNKILNSLGDSCGGGYCGYIESRSKSTQRSYINGISQKSVCIITR